MPSLTKSNIGKIGESIALKYLKTHKYQILDQNFNLFSRRSKKKIGEIDIIAKKEKTYIMVEVKARQKGRGMGIPLESKINQSKKKRMRITAEAWFNKRKIALTTSWQIDIITIVIDLNLKKAQIKHYKNAIEEII
jgi:putative endonuclease